MPTEKPKLSAYLPAPLYERFQEFYSERDLSMSSGATVILSEYFGLPVETTVETTGGVTLERLEQVEKQLAVIAARIRELSRKQARSDEDGTH
ncbi:MAG: hypothetical protein WBB28_02105 [Crinalium sp.]